MISALWRVEVEMKYCFIINPFAGKAGVAEKIETEIEKICRAEGADYDVLMSSNIKHTKEYIKKTAAENDGELTFVACGGDGTICNTVYAIMKLDESLRKNISIGVVPIGTGNDFVSNFNNKELFMDIKAQLHSTPYNIDLLYCNDLYSVNMINIGFDCHVVCKKEEVGRKKFLPRKFAYIFALILTLIKKPGVKIELYDAEGNKTEKKLLLTTLANGSFCGGGFNSNPHASLIDGRIDCIEINDIGRLKFVSLVSKYRSGEHICKKYEKIVSHLKCKKATMHFCEETPVCVDGEIIHTKELNITVARRALSVMLPKGVTPKVFEEQTTQAVSV